MNKLKDSGIPWIGQIPEHWEIIRFKSKFAMRKGLSITKADLTETGIPVVSYGQIHSKYNNGIRLVPELLRYVPSKFIKTDPYALVNKGDFIFADTSEDISGCGNAVFIDNPGQIFAGYHSIIATGGNDNKYFAYLFQSDAWRSQVRCRVTGIKVFSISQAILSNTALIVPPLSEQEAIAAYLDEKCGEIDELIEVEQQMISDLESYRQAVITEAVTHGLNPDAPVNETSIPWVSSIPEHWEEIRLKFLSRISTGDKDTIMANDEGEYPFFVRSPKVERINTFSYDGEAILMAGDGVGAGRVFHHFIGKFDWHQRVYNLHDLNSNIYGRFLFYFLLTNFHKLIDAGSAKSTVDSVRLPMLTNFITFVPPLSEQQEIADYLDTKCAEIDELIKIKQEKIETLKQYRQSLIFEAVTGKTTIA